MSKVFRTRVSSIVPFLGFGGTRDDEGYPQVHLDLGDAHARFKSRHERSLPRPKCLVGGPLEEKVPFIPIHGMSYMSHMDAARIATDRIEYDL